MCQSQVDRKQPCCHGMLKCIFNAEFLLTFELDMGDSSGMMLRLAVREWEGEAAGCSALSGLSLGGV